MSRRDRSYVHDPLPERVTVSIQVTLPETRQLGEWLAEHVVERSFVGAFGVQGVPAEQRAPGTVSLLFSRLQRWTGTHPPADGDAPSWQAAAEALEEFKQMPGAEIFKKAQMDISVVRIPQRAQVGGGV